MYFGNQLAFIRLKEQQNTSKYDFSLLNGYFERDMVIQPFLQSVYLRNIELGPNAFIKVGEECTNFVVENLKGKVDFSGICNMQIIDCALTSDIRSNNESSLYNTLTLDRANHEIYMYNLKLDRSIHFSFGAENVMLQSVEVVHGCAVSVANTVNNLEIYNCKGVFHIPILNHVLSFDIEDCFVKITRNDDDSFDILLSEIQFVAPICLKDNIRSAYIRNISGTCLQISGKCDNLYLENCALDVNYTCCTPFKSISLCNFISVAARLLSIPSIQMILEDVTVHRSVAISDRVKNITLSNVYISDGCILSLNSACDRISVDQCTGMLDIPGITEHSDINCLVFDDAGALHFCTRLSGSVLELELRHIKIDHDIELAETIKNVILSCVDVTEGNALVVSAGCEQLIVKHCTGTIDTTKSVKITALTLTDTPLIYNKEVHRAVTHLCLGHMALSQTVVLGDSIKTLYVSKLITGRGKICINVDCKALYVEHYSGTLLVPNVLSPLHLSYETTVELKQVGGRTSLSLANLKLSNSNALSDNVKALQLSGIATKNHAKLMISRCCEVLDLDNCNAAIDVSSSNMLRTIILRNMNYNHLFEYSQIIGLDAIELHNMDVPFDLYFYGSTRTISMSSVTLRQGRVLVVNGEREEVKLEHCVGTFNMLNVRNLKKLVFVPTTNGYFSAHFPDLTTLDDLTLSYNFDATNIEYLLSHSINITNLSFHSFDGLRSTKHKESFKHEIKSIFESFGSRGDYKQQAMAYCRNDGVFSTDDLISIVNLRMNAFANIIFNFRSCNTLERLCLKGFSLNEQNLKKLQTCTSLKFLSIEIHFVPNSFFRYLPHNLETLRISDECSFGFYDSSNEIACEISHKHLVQHNNLRTLIVSSILVILNDHYFKQLPTKLECLEIGYFDVPEESHELRDTKAVLKQLVIVGAPLNYNHSIVEYSKHITRDHENMLNYLSLFIDFSSLVVLQLRIANTTIDIVPQSLIVRDE